MVASFREKPAEDEKRQGNCDVENIEEHSNSTLAAGV
jgi:hypothetical protein